MGPEISAPSYRPKLLLGAAAVVVLIALALFPFFVGLYQVQLLTYGTLCGGLLSERYLGAPEPGRAALTTASLGKYKPMVDAWGGWALFQELLGALKQIADRHRVSIANVAVRAILDRPAVAGVIVGTRLGVAEHIADNARDFAAHACLIGRNQSSR